MAALVDMATVLNNMCHDIGEFCCTGEEFKNWLNKKEGDAL